MIKIRKSNERGGANHGWLDTKHTFSFSDYYDPNNMGYRTLRVINEDIVSPENGFGMHPHKDMEIITYVISGELNHKDNMGNESVLRAGEFQAMTAGKGVVHSEFNASLTTPVHLIQIWILPEVKGLNPSYQELRPNLGKGLTLVTSQAGRDGSMKINQNADLYFGDFKGSEQMSHPLKAKRGAWLQVISGAVAISSGATSHQLIDGDGASCEGENVELSFTKDTKLLLFDLQ
jgi:redox-sensitive bicupin YhaK (pirin superfamily)